MEPVLSFESVSFSYHSIRGETPAVSNMNFSIYPGEFVVIVGPSGCGKSTILSLACGLLKPEEGIIHLQDINMQIGYMFQKDQLFEWRTLYKNAMLGPELKKIRNDAASDYVNQLISLYGLDEFYNSPPSALSGGMRQRAALIRTLAVSPSLLLLDEPFSALDYQTRLEVADDITTLIRKSKKSVLMVTHDISEAVSVADRIIILTKRPCKCHSTVKIIFSDNCTSPIERRKHPDFSKIYNMVWKELKNFEN